MILTSDMVPHSPPVRLIGNVNSKLFVTSAKQESGRSLVYILPLNRAFVFTRASIRSCRQSTDTETKERLYCKIKFYNNMKAFEKI